MIKIQKLKDTISFYKPLFFIVFLFFLMCVFFYLLTYPSCYYDAANRQIEKGNLKKALAKYKSPFLLGDNDQEIAILEATIHKDVDKTIRAIKSDSCFGKCYHVFEEWLDMLDPYLMAQPTEQEKLDLINYTNNVFEKIKVDMGSNLEYMLNKKTLSQLLKYSQ